MDVGSTRRGSMVLVVCFAEPAGDFLKHAGEEAHAFGLALGIMTAQCILIGNT